ncbi:MAG: hypothetical protein OEY38_04140 [Gammaproteobacteria bacterium]|nr:hypothetical protein [Gammaproteobacteria bacterium]
MLTSCASVSLVESIEPTEADIQSVHDLGADTALQQAEQALTQTQQSESGFLVPEHVDVANKAINDARQLLSEEATRDKGITKVAVANAVLKNSDRVVKQVKSMLKDELEIKQSLDELSTSDVYSNEYESVMDRLQRVIRQIETGQARKADEQRPNLVKDMQALESRAMQYRVLHEADEIMRRVKSWGGEQLAPTAYTDANAVISKAKDFMDKNVGRSYNIDTLREEVVFSAKRALYITKEVAALQHKVKLPLEQLVLDAEYRMYRIARTLSNDDVRDNPLEVQSEMLASKANQLNEKLIQSTNVTDILRNAIIHTQDQSGDGQILAIGKRIENLKKEKQEWLAKDALYKARIQALQDKLEERNAQVIGLQASLLKFAQEQVSTKQSQPDVKKTLLQPAPKPKAESLDSELQSDLNREQLIDTPNISITEPTPSLSKTHDAELVEAENTAESTNMDSVTNITGLGEEIPVTTISGQTSKNLVERLKLNDDAYQKSSVEDKIAKEEALITRAERLVSTDRRESVGTKTSHTAQQSTANANATSTQQPSRELLDAFVNINE